MNKSQLTEKLMLETKLSKAAAARFLDTLLETITETLAKGDSVALIGFGSFVVRERAERSGRNPKTGGAIVLAAAKVPVFRAGKSLKDRLNG
ncbi:MAG: HU family DNA-binding protein [Candidatus Symbiodolus clandestinus]